MTDAEMKTEIVQVTPLTLLDKALSKGVTADELSQWMDLEKRHREDQAKQAFARAFVECQAELPIVVKLGFNDQKKTFYARLEDVAKQVSPVTIKHGFSTSFSESDCPLEGNRRIWMRVRHKDGFIDEAHLDVPIDGKGAKGGNVMNETQGVVSTASYGQRKLMCMYWNITIAGSDKDGEPLNTISEDAIATINGLIETCRELGNEVNVVRFLKACGVIDGGDIGDIKQDKFLSAVNMLNKKIAASAAGASA